MTDAPEISDGTGGLPEEMPPTRPAPKKIENFTSAAAREKRLRNSGRRYGNGVLLYEEDRVPVVPKLVEPKVAVEYEEDDLLLPFRAGTLLCRFLGMCHVDAASGCWGWRGKIGGKNGKTPVFRIYSKETAAIRVAYDMFFGDVSKRGALRPACGNRACINPLHIKPPGRAKKPREYRSKVDRGIKLKLEDVDAIRLSPKPYKELARLYGVSNWSIWAIKNGRRNARRGVIPVVDVMDKTVARLQKIDMLMRSAEILSDLERSVSVDDVRKFQIKLGRFVRTEE